MIRKIISLVSATLLLLSYSPLSAKITEINEIVAIGNHVTSDSLVLFNITGTLYEPALTLADAQWRTYFSERVNALATNKESAERLINKTKNDIVNHLPKKAIEATTPELIRSLQERQIAVLGITQKSMATAYADNFGLITRNHLLSIGINLEKTLSYLNVKDNSNEAINSFAYGIIFTNKKSVGSTLSRFLNRLDFKPAKVIMIDNSEECLADADSSLNELNIQFEGFRYGRADALQTNFDPILGIIQFFAYIGEGKIMYDDEALQIKMAHPEVDYTQLLNNYIIGQL